MRVERPHANASQLDLRRYLRSVARALEEAGVGHGEHFEIVPARSAKRDRYALESHDEDQVGGSAAMSATSSRAALANLPRSGSQRDRILRYAIACGGRGFIADEAAADLSLHAASVRPRVLELRVGGWLAMTGERRNTPRGAGADIHVATTKAYEALGLLVDPQPDTPLDAEPAPQQLFTPPARSALRDAELVS